MKEIDINNWVRKNQYDFFKDFDDPFFGATSNIDCTNLYLQSKASGESFFIHYMHKALIALNEIREFRIRLLDGKVVEFPKIHGSTTVFKQDHTFSFCRLDFISQIDEFYQNSRELLDAAKKDSQLVSKPELDLVYVSVIPWRSFTSVKNPRTHNTLDSIPKIVFGKMFQENGKFLMPVSVEAHHALLDGYHVSCFFNRFEELMSNTD